MNQGSPDPAYQYTAVHAPAASATPGETRSETPRASQRASQRESQRENQRKTRPATGSAWSNPRLPWTLSVLVLPWALACASGKTGSPRAESASPTPREGSFQPPSAATLAAREQTADQQVQQVLNRLAFGPRPGDAAAVRAMGVDRWIDRQLYPDRIPDTAATAFLAHYETLHKSSEALYADYPPPAQALAQLQREQQRRWHRDGGRLARIREQGRRAGLLLTELTSSRVAPRGAE